MNKYFVRIPEQGLLGFALDSFFHDGSAPRPGRKQPYVTQTDPNLLIADFDEQEVEEMTARGAEVFVDVEFETLGPQPSPRAQTPESEAPMQQVGLREVLRQIEAPAAWQRSRGSGVTIAIVDTGVCADLDEFPLAKRSSIDLPSTYVGRHWIDGVGHGSMCASIAAATSADGGRFDGVAPDATLLSARTSLLATDIYLIYDQLVTAYENGTIPGPLVISNSYGLYTCQAPHVLPPEHPYHDIVVKAVDSGIPVVFAAGNNHYDEKCNYDPTDCAPNSIWAVNSSDRVLSVGTVDENGSNQEPGKHANSSRGPGQWANAFPKPDCVAPTYGQVVWGCGYRDMVWWGTSGACPQVAGLAALMLAIDPALTPQQVGDIIRSSCRSLPASRTCVGHGLIDCAAAVAMV